MAYINAVMKFDTIYLGACLDVTYTASYLYRYISNALFFFLLDFIQQYIAR